MKIEDISYWQAFHAVATHGGFSRASQALRIAVPQLSKRVAKLEDRLGVRLFRRSTRSVLLTDEGRALLPRVTSLLEDWASVEGQFESSSRLSGTIRVACVPFVAHRLLIPVLGEFTEAYPEVRVELDLSESMLNLTDSEIDLAIRIDEPEDSDLVYRKLAANDLVFCASPRYLKSAPPLTSPDHLRKHALLSLELHQGCRFRGAGARKLGEYSGSRRIACESGAFLTELALQGHGVLVRSIWDVQEHLRAGRLEQVLKRHPLETFGHIYAVIPSRKLLAPRVRALLDRVVAGAAQWKA